MRAGGRDQRAAMERLVRLAAALWRAEREGVDADVLVQVGGYVGQPDGNREQLARDLRLLSRQGWLVENIAEDGSTARYRMVTIDNRLRLRLSPEESAALQRAGLVADRPDLLARLGLDPSTDVLERPFVAEAPPANDELSRVLTSLTQHSRLRFVYKGRPRVADPQSVLPRSGSWTLVAVEVGQQDPKHFVVDRMREVSLDAPGTAAVRGREPRATLDPLSWVVEAPLAVSVTTSSAFRGDVEALLGRPTSAREDAAGDGHVQLTYTVSNASAFRSRLYELGRRVRVLGPAEFRESMLAELRAVAGGGR